ncbi:MAG: BamA/TamA family outer membrane protein [Prevotella sp.]|nr:BamA/TamA family outer membrane protein [Prevotella sp.]
MKQVGVIVFTVFLLMACAETKYVPEGRYLVNDVKVKVEDGRYRDLDATLIKSYVRQQNNSKWFSMVKLPLKVYSLSGRDTTRWVNRLLRNMGEAPVLFDSAKAALTCNDLQQMLFNKGYLDSRVELWTRQRGRRLSTVYKLFPGRAYYLGHVDYQIKDSVIDEEFHLSDSAYWGLRRGQRFSVDELDRERKRLTELLHDNGYYRFHKEYIRYEADTLSGDHRVNVRLVMRGNKTADGLRDTLHTRYTLNSITFASGSPTDTTIHLRPGVLRESSYLKEGGYYSGSDLQNTYNHFGRLGAVKYTNIQFYENPDTSLLDCRIQLQTNKPSTLSFQPEGTNTSGDLGAAATLTYQNRNLFRGSENLTVELRGAYEAIRGLEGYRNQDFQEYSLETKLSFPRFILPFLKYNTRRSTNATSEVSLMYDLQNRPEFHRRLWSASWRYRWAPQQKNYQYQFDVLDLSYVLMPWISDTFYQQYLNNPSSRNAILRYNYQDLFITKIGFGFTFNNGHVALKTNVETSGNVLNLASQVFGAKTNDQGQDMIFNIAYAQYVKGDIDFTRSLQLAYSDQLVFHVGIGIAWPYGNSTLLPFEKRYFSGGANSLRGWSVRGVGPGRYKGTDGRIDFINQTGDMKLDLNVEYRTHLFWKLDGALFADAGNIWTLRSYPDQPDGQFSFDEFLSQLAASYGVGFRFNFGYFIVRFDLGMKAVNPAFQADGEDHFPLWNPRLSRDFAFHFAVGLPF